MILAHDTCPRYVYYYDKEKQSHVIRDTQENRVIATCIAKLDASIIVKHLNAQEGEPV